MAEAQTRSLAKEASSMNSEASANPGNFAAMFGSPRHLNEAKIVGGTWPSGSLRSAVVITH